MAMDKTQIMFEGRPSSPLPSPPGEGEMLAAFFKIHTPRSVMRLSGQPATGSKKNVTEQPKDVIKKNPLLGERIQVRADVKPTNAPFTQAPHPTFRFGIRFYLWLKMPFCFLNTI